MVGVAALAATATCAVAAGSVTRASIRSAALTARSPSQWTHELGYRKADLHPLVISPSTGAPEIGIAIAGVEVSLVLDTGTARGFMITDHAPHLPCTVEGIVEERNADGSPRGQSEDIRVDSMEVLGARYVAVKGTRADWRRYSSAPFDGTVGLDFFLERRLTLDYGARQIAVTDAPLPERLDSARCVVLGLLDPPRDQGHLLYVRAVVNGRPAIVYVDTGYSSSWLDPAFCEGLQRVDPQGSSPALRRGVPVELGGHRLVLDDVREQEIRRGSGLDAPVALVLGSDILSRLVTTIDLRGRKVVFALAK